jgi:DNA helicase-2/ATP-dependent DNA helicase PcrA
MVLIEKIVEQASQRGCPIFSFCEDLLGLSGFCPEIKLSAKQKEGLQSYLSLIHRLREKRSSYKLFELISETIAESRYLSVLEEDPESFDDRKENLDELIGKAAEWEDEHERPSLPQFLEELSLRTTTEEGKNIPSVHLMTLHNSKGLEFSLAFLVGMEEELFPHINSLDSPESLEEERRLCYVGMTRARRYLYLTAATYRYICGRGGAKLMRPSRFFREVPPSFLKNYSPTTYESESKLTGDPEGFSIGDRVVHQEFGGGVIQKSYHSSFGLTYEVSFENGSATRSLVAKYAKLLLYRNSYSLSRHCNHRNRKFDLIYPSLDFLHCGSFHRTCRYHFHKKIEQRSRYWVGNVAFTL